MTENLIEILKNAVSNKASESIGKYVGIDATSTKSGLNAIIPTVLAGLLGKNTATSTTPSWMNVVSGLFTDKDDDIQVDRLDLAELTSKGSGLLTGLFGNNKEEVTDAVAQSAGIQKDKAGNLLSVAAPLLLGYLTSWMKKKGFSFGDIIGNLLNNKASLAAALPAGLSVNKLFDYQPEVPVEPVVTEPIITESATIEPVITEPIIREPVVTEPEKTRTTYVEPEKKNNNFLKWLLWIVIIGLLLWLLLTKGCKSCSNDDVVVPDTTVVDTIGLDMGTTVRGTLNEAGDWVYDLGDNIQRTLSDGTELTFGSNSVENRLVDFIESDKPADKTTWFSFDRLYFETGSSTLKAESQEQLNNIAAIMKAYPDVELKLGGYTDNTGSEETNMRISGERAKAALDALVGLGVAADRLEAEGYGPQHPIASNDTPEGRAQNRRIDVRVSEK